jgi:thioredoxin-related protein
MQKEKNRKNGQVSKKMKKRRRDKKRRREKIAHNYFAIVLQVQKRENFKEPCSRLPILSLRSTSLAQSYLVISFTKHVTIHLYIGS